MASKHVRQTPFAASVADQVLPLLSDVGDFGPFLRPQRVDLFGTEPSGPRSEEMSILRGWRRACVCFAGLAGGLFAGAFIAGLLAGTYEVITGTRTEQFQTSPTGHVLVAALTLAGGIAGVAFGLLWRSARHQRWTNGCQPAVPGAIASQELPAKAPDKTVVAASPAPSGRQRSAWPTVFLTVLLSPAVGWIPALVQGRRARRNGTDESYYWKAYAASFLTVLAFVMLLRAAAGPE